MTLGTLVIKIQFEGLLELALLLGLVSHDFLLHLILVSQDGAPLIEHFLLLLDWQMSALSCARGGSDQISLLSDGRGLRWIRIIGVASIDAAVHGRIWLAILLSHETVS